jgi:hypothetical protein
VRAILLTLMLLTQFALGADEAVMEDVDSSNTQEGSLNTNTVGSTVNSNNRTDDRSVSNTYNGAGSSSDMPVGSAIAPTYMSNGVETCLQGQGASVQTGIVGLTRGNYKSDEDCNRRRDAKVLSDLGMKVAAIARMCEDLEVWRSMFVSGTPCPMLKNGKLVVGKSAFLLMRREPQIYIPDYGQVKMLRKWDHKKGEWTFTPNFTKKQSWYNSFLASSEGEDEKNTETIESVSAKYRSSLKRAGRSDSDE